MRSARAFALLILAFGAFGFLFGIWQVVIADLKKDLDLSPGALGTALTAGFVASLPAMLIGGRLADRAGPRPVIAGAALLMSAAFVGLFLVRGYTPLVALLIVFLGASGVFDVGINAAAVALEQASSRRVLSYLHAAFSGAAGLGALAAGALLFAGVPYRALFMLIVLILLALAAGVWHSRAIPEQPRSAREAADPAGSPFAMPAILLLAGITALALLSEGTLDTWSAIYLRSSLELPVLLGASGVAVFQSAMLTGRLAAGRAVRHVGRPAILRAGGCMAAAGMLLALVTTTTPLILAGFFVVGLGLAVVVPIAFSLAGDIAPGRAGAATSVITTVSYSGFLVGPLLVGGLAELFGLRLALGSVVCADVLIAVSALWVRASR